MRYGRDVRQGTPSVWAQHLEVHWPKSWRFYERRTSLLAYYEPKKFTFGESTISFRYAENQDVRISPYGAHFRVLVFGGSFESLLPVLDKILETMEPPRLEDLRASFAHVMPIEEDYDSARCQVAQNLLGRWARDRTPSDFALYLDEDVPPAGKVTASVGVVNKDDLLSQIAETVQTEPSYFAERGPAWMSVRRPPVALYMGTKFSSKEKISTTIGGSAIADYWQIWRNHADQQFVGLSKEALTATEGGL